MPNTILDSREKAREWELGRVRRRTKTEKNVHLHEAYIQEWVSDNKKNN